MRIEEELFRDEYERAFGVRPVFNLGGFTDAQLRIRTENLKSADPARQERAFEKAVEKQRLTRGHL